MKVLILNSDSPHNRGDRAILQGMIALIRDVVPNAQITSLSQFKKRDEKWFGINFLKMSPYSTSPIDYLKLLGAARKADVVLWGGGELLKDYTNKLSLYYWWLKIWGIRLVNKRIIGAFQGIGPTKADSSKKVIAKTVGLCQSFIVRDKESEEKLSSWKTKARLISSFDPAVYPEVEPSVPENVIGLGLRRWFHYQRGTWIPNKFKFWKSTSVKTAEEIQYQEALASFADSLIEKHDCDLRFYPMHMSTNENDAGFADEVIQRMKHGTRTSIVDADNLSPAEYLDSIGECRAYIASRLHSAILASVKAVPAVCIYYVDKGRLFFEQLRLSEFSLDIARLQETGIEDRLLEITGEVLAEAESVSKKQQLAIEAMRTDMASALKSAIENTK